MIAEDAQLEISFGLREEEIDAICEAWANTVQPLPGQEQMNRDMCSDESQVLTQRIDGELICAAVVSIFGQMAYVWYLWVPEAHRGLRNLIRIRESFKEFSAEEGIKYWTGNSSRKISEAWKFLGCQRVQESYACTLELGD